MKKLTQLAAALLAVTSQYALADTTIVGQIKDLNGNLAGAKISVKGTDISAATDYTRDH